MNRQDAKTETFRRPGLLIGELPYQLEQLHRQRSCKIGEYIDRDQLLLFAPEVAAAEALAPGPPHDLDATPARISSAKVDASRLRRDCPAGHTLAERHRDEPGEDPFEGVVRGDAVGLTGNRLGPNSSPANISRRANGTIQVRRPWSLRVRVGSVGFEFVDGPKISFPIDLPSIRI